MKCASDFRQAARKALRGKWGIAILVGLLAAILGGVGSSGPEIKFSYGSAGLDANLQFAGQTVYSWSEGLPTSLQIFLAGSAIYIILAALVLAAVYFVLGSVIGVGYARFNLELTHGEKPAIETLFSYFSHWKTTAVIRLLQTLYVLLWSLLLIIPGIIASYSYAMTDYILAEQPELAPREALARSKAMMTGNRWRLFCLQFSFIGWTLLCALTLGIGNLALTPYRQAAEAAFYRDLCGGSASQLEG